MKRTGLRYEDARPGQVLGTAVNYATPEAILAYAQATEDLDPIYYDDAAARASGYPGAVAPAGFHLQYTGMKTAVGQERYVPQGSVHVRQTYRLFRPVLAGDRLTTTVSVVDKYEKRGRRYVNYQSVITNQLGEVVCISDFINLMAEVDEPCPSP